MTYFFKNGVQNVSKSTVQDDGSARPFRYTVEPKSKVNVFKPKRVETDLMAVRASQFGGCFSDYQTLIQSANIGTLWEAPQLGSKIPQGYSISI